jgi:hypothetical protein
MNEQVVKQKGAYANFHLVQIKLKSWGLWFKVYDQHITYINVNAYECARLNIRNRVINMVITLKWI